MNAIQEAKLTMYRAVEQHCDDNTSIIGSVVAFKTAVGAFKTKIASIIGTEQLTDVPLKGIAEDKTVSKQSLCQLAADVASLIYAYAAATGNNTLREEANFPITKLLRTRDDQLAPRCQNIHDIGDTNLAAVKDYGLSAAILTSLQDAITAYAAQTPKPRTALSQRKTYNANIAALFVEADAILKSQMDKTIVSFKAANPDFVSEYLSNRIIIDPATTTTKLTGTVTNKTTAAPIKNATVTATDASTPPTGLSLSTKTTATGKYTLKPLPPANYNITIKATGYLDLEEPAVNAKLGTNNKFDAAMEAT